MPKESFNIQPRESLTIQPKKPEVNKEYFGQQFKKILQEKAQFYDTELAETMKNIAGEEFAKANRNVSILKNALTDFIKIKDFPEEERIKIHTDLALVDENDPIIERLNYYDTEKMEEKNNYAIDHNNKLEQYKSSIIDLLASLQNVLPESMCKELLLRNNMFAGVLKWVDQSKSDNSI